MVQHWQTVEQEEVMTIITDGAIEEVTIMVAETNTTPGLGDTTITTLNHTVTMVTVDTIVATTMDIIMDTIMDIMVIIIMDGEERDLWNRKMILPTSTELGERLLRQGLI